MPGDRGDGVSGARIRRGCAMNPIWGEIAGFFIIAMMIAFIGIWIWAWLPYHKRTFNAMVLNFLIRLRLFAKLEQLVSSKIS